MLPRGRARACCPGSSDCCMPPRVSPERLKCSWGSLPRRALRASCELSSSPSSMAVLPSSRHGNEATRERPCRRFRLEARPAWAESLVKSTLRAAWDHDPVAHIAAVADDRSATGAGAPAVEPDTCVQDNDGQSPNAASRSWTVTLTTTACILLSPRRDYGERAYPKPARRAAHERDATTPTGLRG